MTSAEVGGADYPIDTRQRLLDIAKVLISRHGFAGTSLQMIADELGVTKAAVYYHFKTKDEIVEAIAAPMLAELNRVVHEASARRTRGHRSITLWPG
jgi:AcrR family transcriptional regulator